jgi:hypothetical protein
MSQMTMNVQVRLAGMEASYINITKKHFYHWKDWWLHMYWNKQLGLKYKPHIEKTS